MIAGVAAARAAVTLVLALGFWAAAPTVLGWMPTTVMTASMSPAIEVGDVVVSRPVPRDAVTVGRVVLATDPDWPGRLRLHRVTEVDAAGDLVTKGDANPSADSSPLHPDSVHGVGVLRVPWVGLPIVWLRTGEVVPLALCLAAFGVCLAIALRRGEDDSDAPTPPGQDASSDPPPTIRRTRRALGLTAAVAAVVSVGGTPAWASFSDASAASGSIAAGRVDAPFSLACSSSGGAVISWVYDGWEPRSFDLLVDGRVVESDIAARARSVRVPNDGSYSLFRDYRVTVRANVGATWSGESSESVSIGGGLLGIIRPFCR